MRFIFIIYIIFLVACNNNAQDNILDKFDSVNNKLDKIFEEHRAAEDSQTIRLYEVARGNRGDLSPMRDSLRSVYAYLNDLKGDFQKYCTGDRDQRILKSTWEDTVLTNDFFINKENAYDLWEQMNLAHNSLKKYATDSLKIYVDGTFDLLKSDKDKEYFATGYFQGRPPVMAIGNLIDMEREIRRVENKVLVSIAFNDILNLKNQILQDTTK